MLAGGAAGALALAGCSSGSGSPGSSSASRNTSASKGSSNGSFNGTTTSVNVPAYNVSHNARQDVVAGKCTGDKSTGYVLHGMARNSTASPRTYSIVVDFVTNPGDTVMATRVLNVGPVASQNSANWSTPAAGQGQANLTCVIRQVLWP